MAPDGLAREGHHGLAEGAGVPGTGLGHRCERGAAQGDEGRGRVEWHAVGEGGGGLGSLQGGIKMPSFKRRPNLKIHREEEEPVDPLEGRVDAILKKIQEQGQESLTREEQRLLQQASKKYQQKNR